MASQPVFASIIKTPQVQFLNADGIDVKDIFTAPVGGAFIRKVWVTSTNDDTVEVTLYKNDGSVDAIIETLAISAVSSSSKVQKGNFLDPNRTTALDPADISLLLQEGHSLKVKIDKAITSDKQLNVFVEYGVM